MKVSRYLLKELLVLTMALPGNLAFGQLNSLQDEIKVIARPSLDSIVLRWAPTNVNAWINTVKNGYWVERYTLVRDEKIVLPAERSLLNPIVIKPKDEHEWESLVQTDKYAAIAAQAYFGSDFEMDLQGADVFQIVNKVQENEMRFSFSLFAADMSVPVSIASGLRITDKNIRKGEKYLYRVLSVNGADTIRGSLFVGPEKYELPKPLEFSAEFTDGMVSMRWNQAYHRGIYTAYKVERSADGKEFKPITDALVTLTNEDRDESRYQYATDSLPNLGDTFYYRVRGLTPFGEWGPPSDVESGKGVVAITQVPYIINDQSPDNQVIDLTWEFPRSSEGGIKGFDVRRSSSPRSKAVAVNSEIISPAIRTFRDEAPEQNNYYQVVAISVTGEEYKSPQKLSQLIDSIPPTAPMGLGGTVDDDGIVIFSWLPNSESDIYGYRVYRGNNRREEFFQVTVEPIADTLFTDSISLKTLDRSVFYQVMAIDRNQNHSGLSEILELRLPDKVPPVAPVLLPSQSSKEGVLLQWLPSSSDDVLRYDIYARGQNDIKWNKLGEVRHSKDSLFAYSVNDILEGTRMNFTVLAIDAAGLESVPAEPIEAARLINPVKPRVLVTSPEIDRENKFIKLRWSYTQSSVAKYQIYRGREGETARLYTTVNGLSNDFVDRQLQMNSIYTYQIVALFTSGARSEFSDKIIVNY